MTLHVTTYKVSNLKAESHKEAVIAAMSDMLGRAWDPAGEKLRVHHDVIMTAVYAPDMTGLIDQQYWIDCSGNLDGTYSVEISYSAGHDLNVQDLRRDPDGSLWWDESLDVPVPEVEAAA